MKVRKTITITIDGDPDDVSTVAASLMNGLMRADALVDQPSRSLCRCKISSFGDFLDDDYNVIDAASVRDAALQLKERGTTLEEALKRIDDQAAFDERPWDEVLAAKQAVREKFESELKTVKQTVDWLKSSMK